MVAKIGVYLRATGRVVSFASIVMKKLVILIILVGAGVGGYYGWNRWQTVSRAATGPSRPTTATVELRDISFAVNAAGEIAPAEQVSVRPEINGLLEKLPVDVGDHVKKDSLLFKLTSSCSSNAHRT